MLNRVQLIGNLGADPETKYMPSGDALTNFTIATTKRWKKDGEQKEATEWHRVTAFGKLAEICVQWLRKGAQIYVEGELRTRKWEKDGQNHYTTEIIISEMKMLGKKPEGSGDTQRRNPAPQPNNPPATTYDDDEIPF